MAVFSVLCHEFKLVDIPSPVLMSDRQVDFRNNLNILSSVISLPSNTSLRRSSVM